MSKLRALFFTVIVVFVFTNVNAQYHFRTIDVKAGLNDNYVNAVLRDEDGFMWLGSLNGLSRYDGYHNRIYNIVNRRGIVDNNIFNLQEGADGTLWITTYNGGLFYYERNDDKIHRDFQLKLRKLGISVVFGTPQIITDKDKNLWCIDGNRVYYYSYVLRKLKKIKLPHTPMQIACDGKRAMLLFPEGTLSQIDFRRNRLKNIAKIRIPDATDLMMTLDQKHRVWVYDKYKNGLSCINAINGKKINLGPASFLQDEIVKSVAVDRYGHVWIGTNSSGLYIIGERLGSVVHLAHSVDDEFSIASNHVNYIYCDDNNTVWIGTKSGVSYTSLNGLNVSTIRTPREEDISCFAQDEKGNLYIGYDGKGFDVFSKENVNIRHDDTTNSLLRSNLVIGMNKDVDGSILLGTYGAGFYRLKSGVLSILPHSGGALSLFARHAFRDEAGNLWIGSMKSGLIKVNKDGRVYNFTYKNSVLRTNAITQMIYSPLTKRLYLSTSTGVYYVNSQGRLLNAGSKKSSWNLLQNIQTTTMYVDNRELIWIATAHGLRVYDKNFRLLALLDRRNNLSNAYVQAITGDKSGNIWVTTDDGITHILVKRFYNGRFLFVCYPYYKNDGLGNINFVSNSLFCRANGDILAGGFGKYIVIKPDQVTVEKLDSKVRFTELYLDNEKVDAGQKTADGRITLDKDISLVDGITLNYGENFSLEVSSMNYPCLDNTQYVYRLSKQDPWIVISGNKINLSHLSPGRYELQVKVANSIEADVMAAALNIYILPPFWLSYWAFVAYVILFLLIAFSLWRYMVHKHRLEILRRQRDMEDLQRKKTDELKMRFFTNVSHDLRTPLSLIITPVEQLLDSGRHGDIHDTLQMILRNAESLLSMVNQLLDVRNIADKKESLELTYGDLSTLVSETCESYKPVALKNKVSLIISNEIQPVNMTFDVKKMRRILVNLISNAIKYNQPGGCILVNVTKKGDVANLCVADTGIGIRKENKKKIFQRFFQENHTADASRTGSGIGLYIVKEYVEMMGGSISVEDNTPCGSLFSICLPMNIQRSEVPQFCPITISDEKTLLIVEDNDDFRCFITDSLKDQYQIIQAVNGEDALDKLSRFDINMIISDVMMPVMDGMELCHSVKTNVNFSHIPVILLTARAADEHVIAGYKEGADDYITKPFNVEIFKIRIRKIFNWLKRAQMKFNQPDVKTSELIISNVDERLINKATKLVEDNLDDNDFSVEKFSASMNMSRSALYKKMMAITGRAPLEFMRVVRLRHGLKLMKEGNMNISEIAYTVGLSPKQFSKFFKEEYGCLPSEYLSRLSL